MDPMFCNVFIQGFGAVIEGFIRIPSIGFSADSYYKGYDFIIIRLRNSLFVL